MSPTSISVVIPAYNAARFLRSAIDSALSQTAPPEEVIVVDDGSIDETFEIAASYGAQVRAIRQPNRGEGGARNRGIEEARSDWIAFLDADDVWCPQKLQRQMAFCQSANVVACHTNFRNFGVHDEHFDGGGVPPTVRYSLVHVALHAPILPSSLLVRRGLPIRFPEWASAAVDVMYCLELVQLGEVILCPETLVSYRRHEQSMSADFQFAIRVHQCLTRWLTENRLRITDAEYAAIESGQLQRLVELVQHAAWKRHWTAVDALRSYLTLFAADPDVARYLAEPRWPRWLYSVKDVMHPALQGLRQRKTHPVAQEAGR